MPIVKNKKIKATHVDDHARALRAQLYEIQVQVLKDGEEYTIITADGSKVLDAKGNGKVPNKKNFTDAGFDLYTPVDVVIQPGEVVKVPLNIRMKLPSGAWARIETKSGLGSKGMLVYAGVVDQDYRGIPHVIATNMNIKDGLPIEIKAGSKIAQMTLNPHSLEFYTTEVEHVDTATMRGEGGFGSTGST